MAAIRAPRRAVALASLAILVAVLSGGGPVTRAQAAPGAAASPAPAVASFPADLGSPSPSLSARAGASPAASTEPVQPDGIWEVLAHDGTGDGLVKVRRGSSLTVELLPDGRLEGQTGCGRYVGGYFVEGERVLLGVSARGPADCRPRREAQAAAFILALGAVTSWAPGTSGGLDLLDDAGRVRITLARPDETDGLAGDWVVRGLVARGELMGPAVDAEMAIAFDATGSVSGSTGCRLFTGGYVVDAERLVIVPVEVVGEPCQGVLRRRERALLRLLAQTAAWSREGDILQLRDRDGDWLIRALTTHAVAAPPSASPSPSGSPSQSAAPSG